MSNTKSSYAPPVLIPAPPVHGEHSRFKPRNIVDRDVEQLADEIKNHIDIHRLQLSEAFFYSALPLCVIDAVFSIGASYSATAKVPRRWCDFAGWTLTRGPYVEERTVSDFLSLAAPFSAEELANKVFNNRQRTSTRSGVLKAEAVCDFAQVLKDEGIDSFEDLRSNADLVNLEARIKKIPGQGSGLSFDYFLMLAGSDDYVKADRWICRFVAGALARSSVSQAEAKQLLIEAARHLEPVNSNITPRALDHAIWTHMTSDS